MYGSPPESFSEPPHTPSGGPRVHLGPKPGMGPCAWALQQGPWTEGLFRADSIPGLLNGVEPSRAAWSLGSRTVFSCSSETLESHVP